MKGGILPRDGGGERAAKNDLEFFRLAGQIRGEAPKVEAFWSFGPLQAALGRLGS